MAADVPGSVGRRIGGDMETVASGDGTRIAFDISGKGAHLVLVSGASTSRSVHLELAALLAAHFTVVNYDRRGRGDSGDTLPYAVEREIEDLEAVIAAAGGRAAVFGNSSGAALALRAAAALPGITSLALWEPPFMVDPDAAARAAAYASRLNGLLSANRCADAVELFLSTVGLPHPMITGMRGSPAWQGMEAIAHTLAYDAAVMGDSTVPRGLLSRVTIPTLILTGDQTGAWSEDAAHALADTLPAAEHRVLAGQNHAVAWDVLAAELQQSLTRAGL